ncbi:ribulose-bisphosphate carboxylase large subunit family protein [Catalinimonas niigatensis]|uniref:ribulose-bisphosphate carboxylase large subunit family protein n=1 Tax=Catalinimonas niigatensis TaxID=1397264 RepID=UPI0026659F7B|nr:ribulose-bisphosphate carboxylase large subunit family protein [Catalinimonas niigatensis]WPP50953.1 ribulose-bisphosphate carboxylase large subunit family protein [Catalinimonas niigatensis]
MAYRPIKAKYLIETAYPLEQAAEIMAGEQSSGTFVKTPGETRELKEKHGAGIASMEEIEERLVPALPGTQVPKGISNPVYKRAYVELAWPLENVGLNLSNLMATVAGNLFELSPFSALKLLDITVPDAFNEKYPGPQFGIKETRRLCDVYERPIIGTIIKPSVGLSPQQTAQQVHTLIEAGLDFVKDDELMGDSPHSPFTERVDAVMDVINRYAQRNGKKPMFAFNLSGDVDDMLFRHDYVLQKGGSCVMISLNWVGISGVNKLAQHTQLPIHGHRNGWGLYSRSEDIGIAFKAYHKIFSMAGVDHLHTNGIRNKFCESDESVLTSIRACLNPDGGGYPVMPVISSGQWAEQAFDTYRQIQSTDLMYLCGGGITGHPGGMAAGVRSIQLAWEGAVQGKTIHNLQAQHPEIDQAIALYGK